jgi:hypothetical protein
LRVAAAQAQAKTISYMGFGSLDNVAVPSDITFFGLKTGGAQPQLIGGAKEFDNEGKYIWDASIGVPVNKISLLEYSEDGGNFVPKTLNKQSIYGMINIYPVPVDTKEGNLRWYLPRAVGGLGLTGRPGDSFFIGMAWGIPQFQFMVGSGFVTQRKLRPGGDAANPADFVQRYVSRTTYGINVPVFSALKRITDKKKE